MSFPVSAYPYLLDGISPITESQAQDFFRLGMRHRIYRRASGQL